MNIALNILGRWREICIIALIASSLARIYLVDESRAKVKYLSYLKADEELLLKEKNRLGLEESVLTRPVRLKKYATQNLGLNKPKKITKISNTKLISQRNQLSN